MPQDTAGARPQGGASFLVALRLAGRHVLVVGGGDVAASRVFFALDADAQVTLLCDQAALTSGELKARIADGHVQWRARRFGGADELDGVAVVLACVSEDVALSQEIAGLCRERRIPCNIADIPRLCDFWLMSQFRDGDLQVAVSTNGNGPKLANRIRRHIQDTLPRNAGQAIHHVGDVRQRVRVADPAAENAARRMRWLSELCDGAPLGVLASLSDDQKQRLVAAYTAGASAKTLCPVPRINGTANAAAASSSSPWSRALTVLLRTFSGLVAVVLRLLFFWRRRTDAPKTITMDPVQPAPTQPATTPAIAPAIAPIAPTDTVDKSSSSNGSINDDNNNNATSTVGRIALIGAGPGDPELLTRRAFRMLQEADVVIADKLLPIAMLDLVKAKLHIAKKFKGRADEAQDETNDVALDALRAGKFVVRLKGGDPFVYGRGGEEILFFRKHGFEPVVVPGISSVFAAPSAALIPVTHRAVADQVLVCTGHDRHGNLPDMPPYSAKRTCVMLMGSDRLGDLGNLLVAKGFPADCPAAIVECATWPEQRVLRGTITTLKDVVANEKVTSPATIVIGGAVNALAAAV